MSTKPCRKVRHKDKTSALIHMRRLKNTQMDVYL